MKARLENGKIKRYPVLPNTFGRILGFRNASKEQLELNGFYDLVYPELLNTEEYGEPIIYKETGVITYLVKLKPVKTEEELLLEEYNLEQRINAEIEYEYLHSMISDSGSMVEPIDDFIINGISLPKDIIDSRTKDYNNYKTKIKNI